MNKRRAKLLYSRVHPILMRLADEGSEQLTGKAVEKYVRGLDKEAFWQGFEKQAATLKTLRRAANTLKDLVVKRRVLVNPLSGESRIGKKALKGEMSFGHVTAGPGAIADQRMTGKVLASGDLIHEIKPMLKFRPDFPALPTNGTDKELINRISLLHEGSEIRHGALKENAPQWGGGHVSPKVILEEHNILATLPKGHRRVIKKFFSAVRGGEKEVLEQNLPGFRYGHQRYSRHAIKHLAEILERKGVGVRPRE